MKTSILPLVLAISASLMACGGDDGGGSGVQDAGVENDATVKTHSIGALGQPLELVDQQWTSFEFPDTTCRDGTPAGIKVFRNSASTKLMIYLEGGGACFDATTCLLNPTNMKTAALVYKEEGLFDRTNPANPVKDWNVVYASYCSGDVWGGSKHDVTVPGVNTPQQFTGYTNVGAFLKRIVPTFPNPTDILLAGISAGGFGAAQNAVQVAGAWPNVQMRFIDDSGPGFSTKVMPSCLQAKWRDLWGFDDTFLKDCGDACPNRDDFVRDYALAVARSFPNGSGGIIESLQDSTISTFLAAGNNSCTGQALVDQVPLEVFTRDLLDFRALVAGRYPNFGTYFPEGIQHTWLSSNMLYANAVADGTRMIDWVTKIVNGQPAGNAGP